jgi:cobalamin synthase
MGFGTTYFIPFVIEPFLWIAMLPFCAFIIARFCERKYFLNGLMVGILINIWNAVIHFIFFDAYLTRHPAWAHMEHVTAEQIRWGDMIFSPVIGIFAGLLIGLFSWAAAMVFKKKSLA